MGVFYKVSDKQLLHDRNNLFKEIGMPALEKKGFVKSPFNGAWHGEFDKSTQAFYYDFCRISSQRHLEILCVSIIKGDDRINVYLCVFELVPPINSISELSGYEGIPFLMTVKNKSKYMKLRCDDYKGPPLFYMLFLPEHKIGRFHTKKGYERQIERLKNLIKKDMENIDDFIRRWHELHQVNQTDWEGKPMVTPQNQQ